MKILTALIVTAAAVTAVAAWFIHSGIINVAATYPHNPYVRWLFVTVRDQSIDERARAGPAPDLTEPKLIRAGAWHYAQTCALCHGAPGQELSEIAKGLNPPPPELRSGEVQKKYSDAELHWIVGQGIRMTGMPAFAPTHDERDLWAIIAFVKRLPEIGPEQYEAMSRKAAAEQARAAHHSS